jgi:signal transduction histidine kinase
LGKLFKLFGQASSIKDLHRSQIGLGLTISKLIVERLGGSIKVESVPGTGSRFSFTLPQCHVEESEKAL